MIVVWVEGHIGSFEESLPRFRPRLGSPGLLGLYLPAHPPQVSLKSTSDKLVIFSLPLVPDGRVSVVVVIVEAEDAVVVFVVVAVVDSDDVVVFVVVMVVVAVVVVVVVVGDGVGVGFGVAVGVGVVVGFAVGVVGGVGVGVVLLRHKPEFFLFLILLGSHIQLFRH